MKNSNLVAVPGNIRRKLIGSESYKREHYKPVKIKPRRRPENKYPNLLRVLRGGF